MKKILILSFFAFMGFYGNAAVKTTANVPELNMLGAEFSQMSPQNIIDLTPKKYHAMTGKKLTVKQVIALKVAQTQLKKQNPADSGISKGVYVLLAILIPFLAVGLATDFKGSDWIIALLLGLTCIGGIIYALIKMKDYY